MNFALSVCQETAASLRLQLENARKVREASKAESGASAPDFAPRRRDEAGKRGGGGRKRKEEEEDNVVVLSRTSKSGLVQPVLGTSDDIKAAGAKRRKNVCKKPVCIVLVVCSLSLVVWF